MAIRRDWPRLAAWGVVGGWSPLREARANPSTSSARVGCAGDACLFSLQRQHGEVVVHVAAAAPAVDSADERVQRAFERFPARLVELREQALRPEGRVGGV